MNVCSQFSLSLSLPNSFSLFLCLSVCPPPQMFLHLICIVFPAHMPDINVKCLGNNKTWAIYRTLYVHFMTATQLIGPDDETRQKSEWNNLSSDAFFNNYVGAHLPFALTHSLLLWIKEKLMTNAIAMHSNDITIITLTLTHTRTHMCATGDKRICFDIKLNAN